MIEYKCFIYIINYINYIQMAQFDWLPILQGKYMTYYQIGALIFSAICLLFAFLFFIAYLLVSKMKFARQQRLRWSNSFLSKLSNFTFVGIFTSLSGIPLVCSSLDVINLLEGIIGMFAIYLICIYLLRGVSIQSAESIQEIELRVMRPSQRSQPLVEYNNVERMTFTERCFRNGKLNKKYIIIAAIVSIFFPVFFYKTCISFYNDQIGYTSNLFGPAINTYWARLLELKRSCPPGPPCHVYATIPEDPTTAFFLNIHTHPGLSIPPIAYYQELHTEKPDIFVSKQFTSYEYHELEWLASRKVHSVLIKDLKPNTKYLLKVKYDNQFYVNAIYKTLPSDPKVPVRMLNAGDSGYTHASHNLSKLVVQYHPDIFFMGGDVAYDNNIPACAYTWDFFLSMIEGISNELGYIMPIVLTVGNHDVGLNELSGINISLDSTAYFKYFPQQFVRDGNGTITDKVPAVSDRRSFLHFRFGNVEYLTLDSGYLHGFDGIQKTFINNTFFESKNRVKFVNYHVPIYSICQRFDKNPQRFLYALFHWVPLFDDYRVMTVFQNHVHSFKRTKPLKSNQPSPNGTVYVGDGAYGAVLAMLCKPDATMNIFQTTANSNNVWISEIRQTQVQHWAIDSRGKKLDDFIQKINAYV